jgi:light-regulated signal transduction histidine kinase (bacteriophytochrome)
MQPCIRVDAEGRIVEFDEAAAKLFGCNAADALGKPLAELACTVLARESAVREAAVKELESLSYAVAHDLRAPLRHIQGFVGLLQNDAKDVLKGEPLHFLEVIGGASKRMNAMLEGLLAYSRIARVELKSSQVDMAQLLEEAIAGAKKAAGGRAIEWKVGETPPTLGDRALLAQVWAALLDNAVKFTRNTPAARIEAGCRRDGGVTEYYVRDNGAGFDGRYAGKLMKVFQRVHAESEYEGLGVGLATAQRIVARHGGSMRIEGAVGEGAGVYFTLPG